MKENEVKRSGTADNNKQIQKDFNSTVNCTNEHNKELTRKLSLIYDMQKTNLTGRTKIGKR